MPANVRKLSWRLVLTSSVVALLAATGCSSGTPSPDARKSSDASPSPSIKDKRFAEEPPSIDALKNVCEDAIEVTSKSVVKKPVEVSWTWPSKHVQKSVRCYNGFNSTMKGPKHQFGVTEVVVWVELRPHLDREREAALPPKKQQTSCDLLGELSKYINGDKTSIEGVEVCTVGSTEKREKEYHALSGYIDRSTVVAMGTTGFVRLAKNRDRKEDPFVDQKFVKRVHDELVKSVVKRFSEVD